METLKIWYSVLIDSIPIGLTRYGTFVLKLTSQNYHKWPNLIQACISKFSSEVDWDEMWDLEEAHRRLEDGDIMFIMLNIGDDNPHGFVWFKEGYLYNAFMHKAKQKNDTVDFISYCCKNLDHNIKEIKLYCDDWNIKAQKMFEKVGFERD